MNRKKTFVAPTVVNRVSLVLEEAILGPSIVYNTDIVSMGQEVVTHDFSDDNSSSYTAEWE